MPLKGLLNPANAAPDTGGGAFKEGLIRIDKSYFRVKPGRDADPKKKIDYIAPVVTLTWDITRLDESMEPLTDEHDAPITEQLDFSLGGKSLANVHPGLAENPDDEEIEDAGEKPNTEGPTLHLINEAWQIHPKSGIFHLYTSLVGKYDDKYINRTWAPDHVGVICFVKTQATGEKMTGTDGKERDITPKVVDRVVRGPYAGKKGGAAAGKAAAGGEKKDPKATEYEGKLKPILQALSSELDGEQITLKRLALRVGEALKKADVDAKLHVPVLAMVKDQAWLKANATEFDMTVNDDNSVVFGTLKD